jgi:hypothetical protein
VTTIDARISQAGASPSTIREGIVTGAVIGMNVVTWASVPPGSSSTANPTSGEITIVSVSGVVVACSSSSRGTSAPATANADA